MQLPSGAEETAAFIEKWFEEKGVFLLCAACGHSKTWRPTQYAAAPWVTAEGQVVETQEAGPLFYQLLPLYCGHCGFIVFFNAGVMGGLPTYFPEHVPEVGGKDQPM